MSSSISSSDQADTLQRREIPDLGSDPKSKIDPKAVTFVVVMALVIVIGIYAWSKSNSNKSKEAGAKEIEVMASMPEAPKRTEGFNPPVADVKPQDVGVVASQSTGTTTQSVEAIALQNKRMGIVISADGKSTVEQTGTSVVSTQERTVSGSVTGVPRDTQGRPLFFTGHGSSADTAQIGVDGQGQSQDLVRRRAAFSGEVSVMIGGRFMQAGESASVQHASAERRSAEPVNVDRRSTDVYVANSAASSSSSNASATGPTTSAAKGSTQRAEASSRTTTPSSPFSVPNGGQNKTPPSNDSRSSAPAASLNPVSTANPGLGGLSAALGSPVTTVPASPFSLPTQVVAQATPQGAEAATEFPTTKARAIPRSASNFVLQGSMIECVMQFRLISTLSGPVQCNVTRDVRSSNGLAVLIPSGSKVMGEYRREGMVDDRVAISWRRLVTPDNTDIAINSAGFDPLGSVGIPADVDRQMFKRFGVVMFYSLFSDIFKAAVYQNGPAVIKEITAPNGEKTIVREPLDMQTVKNAEKIISYEVDRALGVLPRLTILPGALINISAAQDLDFSAVIRR